MNSCQKNLPCSFNCVLNGDIFLLLKSFSEPQLSLLYAAISFLTLCHSVLLLSQLKAHIHPRRYIRHSLSFSKSACIPDRLEIMLSGLLESVIHCSTQQKSLSLLPLDSVANTGLCASKGVAEQ